MSRSWPIALCLVLVVLVPATAAGTPGELPAAWELTRRGTDVLLGGDAQVAAGLFQKALALVPDFPAARLGLGHVALARGDGTAALDHYLGARRGYETLGAGLVEVERLRADDARARIEALHRQDDDFRRQLERGLGEARVLEARLKGNESRRQQLAVVAPLEVEGAGVRLPGELFFHVGNALFRLEDVAGAAEAWGEAVHRSPGFALGHANLAIALLNLHRLEEARASLSEAARLGFEVDPRLTARLDALTQAAP